MGMVSGNPSVKRKDVDVLIVGAGFAGLFMLYRAKSLGLTAKIIEAGDGVGGTWYWNRYPGARCDVESVEYSYKFSEELQQEWVWSEKFATQPEILRYLEHVADRFNLRSDIIFSSRVLSAVFDETSSRWTVESDNSGSFSARFCVMATGCLSVMNKPEIAGLKDFEGDIYYTGQWPHAGVDFAGKKVGVIGTGSSSIQCIPIIAKEAASLTVFQRTPGYTVPARNRKLSEDELDFIKSDYAGYRQECESYPFAFHLGEQYPSAKAVSEEERQAVFEERWNQGGLSFLGAYEDLLVDRESNDYAAQFLRDKIRRVVKNPTTAKQLLPTITVGCKRLCLDTGYYETYNRDNVDLVDVNEFPIVRFVSRGIETKSGTHILDSVVFGTGFDAMTGALDRIDIRGRGGVTLKRKWHAGPRAYLGLSSEGFPNMFFISGPGSPSVLSNMVASIEQHVEFISRCISHTVGKNLVTIEATREAEDLWVDHVNAVAADTLYPGCNSWYLGANVPGKPRIFMALIGFPDYVKRCLEIENNGYEGFVGSSDSVAAAELAIS